jgi:hypothetical protein
MYKVLTPGKPVVIRASGETGVIVTAALPLANVASTRVRTSTPYSIDRGPHIRLCRPTLRQNIGNAVARRTAIVGSMYDRSSVFPRNPIAVPDGVIQEPIHRKGLGRCHVELQGVNSCLTRGDHYST